jgi:hypothetical protein
MQYLNGEEILVGDKVTADSVEGIVVCVIDSKQFTEDYPENSWAYLEEGALVETEEMGLLHYQEADEDLILVERSNAS